MSARNIFVSGLVVSGLAVMLSVSGVPAPAAAEELLKNVRLEIGGGIQAGDPDIEFAGASDELDTGTGYAVGAGIWLDRVFIDYLSVGVQYLRLAGNDFSESGSGTVLGVAVSGTLDIEPTIDAFMANAALRLNDGRWHPYVGGGIGLAHASADVTLSATFVVNGQTFVGVGSAEDSDTSFAGQAFAGVDFDVTDNIYVGLNGRYFITNSTLHGADVDFRNVAGMAVVGFRF